MFLHSRKQQLVFFQYIQNKIKNPHLSLYIREQLKGEDIQLKSYLKKLPARPGTKQEAYDLLWWYTFRYDINNQYIRNTLESITPVTTTKQIDQLKEKLTETFKLLNLPEDNE